HRLALAQGGAIDPAVFFRDRHRYADTITSADLELASDNLRSRGGDVLDQQVSRPRDRNFINTSRQAVLVAMDFESAFGVDAHADPSLFATGKTESGKLRQRLPRVQANDSADRGQGRRVGGVDLCVRGSRDLLSAIVGVVSTAAQP